MKFSISIPVCGQAEFFKTTMDSLRCQTEPFELAVLDATPDNSIQTILKPYQDIIAYQYHHPDNGQSAAIQEGWDHTDGEIVAWLNADDYYFPDTLTKVAKVFREHPEVDVVYGHGVYVSADLTFQMYFPGINPNLAALKQGCIICQPSCFIRRSAMERVQGVSTDLHYVMDWDLWLKLYHTGCKFHFLDELLSVARIYPETKTSSGGKPRCREIYTILRANTSWLRAQLMINAFKLQNQSTHFLFSLLNVARHWFLGTPQNTINGLERRTNRVQKKCEIILPCYEPVSEIIVITNQPAPVQCHIEGKPITLQYESTQPFCFARKNLTSYQYRAKCSVTNQAPVISLESNQPWRLLGVKFL